jgi:glycosyltransferase involved in cell wall biosynthesis
VIPHGVDAERFAGAPAAPADLDGLERPLVGYVGLLDDYLDLRCFTATADALERGTVVLVGGANTDVSALERHPRIRLLGRRPYEEIPAYLHAFAVALVPFDDSPLSRGVNPIKLREYLAAGLPVVSTPMPEVLPYADVVRIAEPGAPFAQAVLASLAGTGGAEARRERVAGESWDAVAARLDPLLRSLL